MANPPPLALVSRVSGDCMRGYPFQLLCTSLCLDGVWSSTLAPRVLLDSRIGFQAASPDSVFTLGLDQGKNRCMESWQRCIASWVDIGVIQRGVLREIGGPHRTSAYAKMSQIDEARQGQGEGRDQTAPRPMATSGKHGEPQILLKVERLSETLRLPLSISLRFNYDRILRKPLQGYRVSLFLKLNDSLRPYGYPYQFLSGLTTSYPSRAPARLQGVTVLDPISCLV
ncbi:hypothetical protein VNO77_03773 [Canavalia gladiata]|uniref:Uncharacterized protein n=1 Tax=Canavalia gladiata TaxID=3824 RepID=A0AAN9R8G2_CANGL